MCADSPLSSRVRSYSKTVPKTRRVSKTKAIVNRRSGVKHLAGFRSQFELSLARSLKDRGINFEYENSRFTYVPKPKTYTPDFYLPDSDIYVEAKGHLCKADRVKMVLVKNQHPDLDIRFVFMNANNKIYRGSKTTYADWCERHNFKWAEGGIPSDWMKRNDK